MGIVNSTSQTCTYPMPPEQIGTPIQTKNKVYNTYETSNERKNQTNYIQNKNQRNQKIGNTIPIIHSNKSKNILSSSSNIQINQTNTTNTTNTTNKILEERIGNNGEEKIEITEEENETMKGGKKKSYQKKKSKLKSKSKSKQKSKSKK